LSVVLYGYETLSLTVREEHKLKQFEKRVLSEEDNWTGEERGNGTMEKTA
jgi:hypothetical protein